jgi:hypothetical protein
MRKIKQQWFGLLILFLCVRSFAQSGPPPLPANTFLQSFRFNTNFQGMHGYLPIAYTNIESEPVWWGDALLIGNTNTAPSFLQYHVVETNHYLNLDFVVGSILFAFAPDWASADATQNGTGPGERAYFLGAGDWTTNSPSGFFGLSADAYGTNLSFWGLSNGVATTYVNAQISWASNAFHYVDCEYSPSNSFLYLDGELAASGTGVTIVPGTNVWTNGFFIGSDSLGYEQARGAFWAEEIWSAQLGGDLDTNGWNGILSEITNWESTNGGGFEGMMGGLGLLNSTNCACTNYGTNVYITNMSAMPDANADGGTTFTFTIAGGAAGTNYDVFSTTNFVGNTMTNATWTWLGQGTNCGRYFLNNQATNQTFYLLGGTLASDGSGLTVAYENLIPNWKNADPNNPSAGVLTVTIVSPAQGAIIQ